MMRTCLKQGRIFAQVVSLLALAATGCQAPPSKLAAGRVLSYGVSHMSGDASLEVDENGQAEVIRVIHGSTSSRRGKLTSQRLGKLLATMREHDCCTLRSGRSKGVPDEAHPHFAVRAGGLDCRVGMFDNEIHDDDDAKACFDAVEQVVDEVFPVERQSS